MALYRDGESLKRWENDEFLKDYGPGQSTAWSGIYRCQGCGREIVHITRHPLPAENHHPHTRDEGTIRWRLLVTDGADPS